MTVLAFQGDLEYWSEQQLNQSNAKAHAKAGEKTPAEQLLLQKVSSLAKRTNVRDVPLMDSKQLDILAA